MYSYNEIVNQLHQAMFAGFSKVRYSKSRRDLCAVQVGSSHMLAAHFISSPDSSEVENLSHTQVDLMVVFDRATNEIHFVYEEPAKQTGRLDFLAYLVAASAIRVLALTNCNLSWAADLLLDSEPKPKSEKIKKLTCATDDKFIRPKSDKNLGRGTRVRLSSNTDLRGVVLNERRVEGHVYVDIKWDNGCEGNRRLDNLLIERSLGEELSRLSKQKVQRRWH